MKYYCLFVELSLQQCTKNDYTDKKKLKAHNAASKKLKQLEAEMREDNCEDILYKLLSHEDDRVKINAASLCLQMNVLVSHAECVLQSIIDSSDDSTLCFSAEMILQQKIADDSVS